MGVHFQPDLKRVRELYIWNQRVLAFGGIWPLEKSFFRFYVGALYFASHMVLAFSDLVIVSGDFTLMLANLIETSGQILAASKIMVLRHSTLLHRVVTQVQSAINDDRHMDEVEKKLYLPYNEIGRLFFQAGCCFTSGSILMYFLSPLENIVRARYNVSVAYYQVLLNETIAFVLPCRVHVYYEVKDLRRYILTYLWQCPAGYYYLAGPIASCFLCNLIVHVAGDLAILAHRIRNINYSDALGDYCDPEIAFRNIVIQHGKIISTVADINHIFYVTLLVELLIMTVLMGLISYNILVVSLTVSMTVLIHLTSYVSVIFILVFHYCIIGDYLIRESMNVHDAYYECHWYDMASKYRKHLIICMSRARKPLELAAGPFYVYSLSQFTDIIKTSMAYISMLRTLV